MYFEALPNVKKEEKKRSADLNYEGSGLPDTTLEMRNLTTIEATTAQPTTTSFVYGYMANMRNVVILTQSSTVLSSKSASTDQNVLDNVRKNSEDLMRSITGADIISSTWLPK